MSKEVKLLIGVPMLTPSYEFFTSWSAFWTDVLRAAQFEVGYSFKHRKPQFVAAEELVEDAIGTGCSHILFMDDDILDVSLLDLSKLLEADVDIIGGVMVTKRFPFHDCALRRLDPKRPLIEHALNTTGFDMYSLPLAEQKGIKPVDLISFGLTLIKTSVFEKMKKPYFLPDPEFFEFCKINPRAITLTDSIFFDKALNAGIQPYAHYGVWLNHNGVTRDNKSDWISIYRKAGKLTQPGIKLNQKELLEHKMIIKELMTEAEERFKSEALDKIKFYKERKAQDEAELTHVGRKPKND